MYSGDNTIKFDGNTNKIFFVSNYISKTSLFGIFIILQKVFMNLFILILRGLNPYKNTN